MENPELKKEVNLWKTRAHQLRVLNPGMELNLKGLSPDSVVADRVLIDIAGKTPLNIEDPNLGVFHPEAPAPIRKGEGEEAVEEEKGWS